MPVNVFVSYRKDDAAAYALLIRDALRKEFGDANVFMDIDRLPLGQPYTLELAKALYVCDVLVAVIGLGWMEEMKARKAKGERDHLREEIAVALGREIAVIPVLVGREGRLPAMPRAAELDENIRGLTGRQTHSIAYEKFKSDAATLCERIREETKSKVRSSRTVATVARLTGLAVLVFLASYLAIKPSFNHSPNDLHKFFSFGHPYKFATQVSDLNRPLYFSPTGQEIKSENCTTSSEETLIIHARPQGIDVDPKTREARKVLIASCWNKDDNMRRPLFNHCLAYELKEESPIAEYYYPALQRIKSDVVIGLRKPGIHMFKPIDGPNTIGLECRITFDTPEGGQPVLSLAEAASLDAAQQTLAFLIASFVLFAIFAMIMHTLIARR